MNKNDKNDKGEIEGEAKKDLEKGVPLSNFLQILAKKNRGKTAAEIAEEESKKEALDEEK